MKDYQFEEITAALSIIITLLAHQFQVNWLFWIYFIKSILDTYYALKLAYKSAKKISIEEFDEKTKALQK